MSDDHRNAYIPFGEVGKDPRMPRRRGGSRLSFNTVLRWHKHGQRGVRLRAIRVGATLCTTSTWLDEFFAALADRDVPSAPDSHDGARAAAAALEGLKPSESAKAPRRGRS